VSRKLVAIQNGVRDGGGTKSKYAVAPNTARAFHRTESFKEKNKVGAV
jgi:hypothetical protein